MADVTVLETEGKSALYVDGELRLVRKNIEFKEIALALATDIRFVSAYGYDYSDDFPVDLDEALDDYCLGQAA